VSSLEFRHWSEALADYLAQEVAPDDLRGRS
jgi:hypothetical protein